MKKIFWGILLAGVFLFSRATSKEVQAACAGYYNCCFADETECPPGCFNPSCGCVNVCTSQGTINCQSSIVCPGNGCCALGFEVCLYTIPGNPGPGCYITCTPSCSAPFCGQS